MHAVAPARRHLDQVLSRSTQNRPLNIANAGCAPADVMRPLGAGTVSGEWRWGPLA